MAEAKQSNDVRVSDAATSAATKESPEILAMLGTSLNGLSEEEAAARLERHGADASPRRLSR